MKELNLLPQEYKERLAANKQLQKHLLHLIIFLLTAVVLNLLPYYLLQHYKNSLSQLETNIGDPKYIEPVEISNRIIDLQSELYLFESIYNNLSKPTITDLDTFKLLAAQLPKGVKIETINFTNSDRTVLISGISESRMLVADYITNLTNLQTVNEVTILELELLNKNPSDSINYSIQVFMNVSEDAS